MIVYNVQRQWFTMKADAETCRKGLKLPPKAIATVRIDSREELAGLLNALSGPLNAELPKALATQLPPEVIQRAAFPPVIAPDFVPRFLIERDGA